MERQIDGETDRWRDREIERQRKTVTVTVRHKKYAMIRGFPVSVRPSLSSPADILLLDEDPFLPPPSRRLKLFLFYGFPR